MYKAAKFTVQAGRLICKDGEPFIRIDRTGETGPAQADQVTHVIASLLNEHAHKSTVRMFNDGYRVLPLCEYEDCDHTPTGKGKRPDLCKGHADQLEREG